MQRKSNGKLLWIIAGLIFALAALLLCAGVVSGGVDEAKRQGLATVPVETGIGSPKPSPASTAELDDDARKALEELDKLLSPSATPAAPKPKSVPTKPTIAGDDLVHVGEDVPAGVYRAAERISKESAFDICYWSKSRDSEGSDIIDNDLPAGGRPQVTLKKGQWFKSQGCPLWVKR